MTYLAPACNRITLSRPGFYERDCGGFSTGIERALMDISPSPHILSPFARGEEEEKYTRQSIISWSGF